MEDLSHVGKFRLLYLPRVAQALQEEQLPPPLLPLLVQPRLHLDVLRILGRELLVRLGQGLQPFKHYIVLLLVPLTHVFNLLFIILS